MQGSHHVRSPGRAALCPHFPATPAWGRARSPASRKRVPAAGGPALAAGGTMGGLFDNVLKAMRRSRSGTFREGSSRRGRRWGSGSGRHHHDEPSGKGDSSTHSALFDLELSSRGRGAGGGAADLLARLNSSVHDEGSAHGAAGGGDASSRRSSALLQRVIYLGRPVMEFELDLLQDVRAVRPSCQVAGAGQLDLSAMVDELQDLGYACFLKRNNPADPGHRHNVQPSCLEKLRHEFIVVAGRADGSLMHWCMVDPRFREQFGIAHPTPAYDRVLRAVPVEFVGTPLRLQALVDTLCGEIAEAFEQQHLTLPPWRKPKAVLSKWFDPEELPGGQPAHAPPPPPQVQLQAAAGPPLSPFGQQQQQQQAAGPVGPQQRQQGEPAAAIGVAGAVKPQLSLLQQQAAAALAERQSSGGGSQDFFDALEMHKQSMRLQQQQQQQATSRTSPTRMQQSPQQQQGSPAQQQQTSPSQQQQQQRGQQTAAPAALSPENLRQLDASYGQRPAASAAAAGMQQQQHASGERSNKPRRRRPPPAGLTLASDAQQRAALASLWMEEDGMDGMPGEVGGLGSASLAQQALHGSGSWSELSTILETRSGASSPAMVALLAAGNAQPGTSCASRRSAGSAAALAASQRRAASSGSDAASLGAATGGMQPSPGTSLVFAAPAPLPAKAAAGIQQQSSSPLAPANALLAASPAGASGSQGAEDRNGSARGGSKAVSLLARSLKSVGQRQTWAGLLPGVNSVRRLGGSGQTTPQRTWSSRSGGSEDGSSRRGRRGIVASPAPQPQAALPPPYPRAL